MQPDATRERISGVCRAAVRAVSADFKAGDENVELALALNLPFETVEQSALELGDLAAPQTCHMDVIPLWAPFVEMLLALQVHEIEFIDQAVALEQAECAIDGDAIDVGIELAGATQNLTRIEMLLRSLHNAQNGAPLMRHAQATRHEFGLQTSRSFGLR
jgi:hypothetical protein